MSEAKRKAPPTDPRAVVEFKRGAYSSQSAVAHILSTAKQDGIPDAFSRSTQQRARTKVTNEPTPYGPCIFEEELAAVKIAFTSPCALLHRLYAECAEFRRVLRAAYSATPCSLQKPWSLVLYCDGVSPSDSTNMGIDGRDMQLVYGTFFEIDRLNHEDYCLRGLGPQDLQLSWRAAGRNCGTTQDLGFGVQG